LTAVSTVSFFHKVDVMSYSSLLGCKSNYYPHGPWLFLITRIALMVAPLDAKTVVAFESTEVAIVPLYSKQISLLNGLYLRLPYDCRLNSSPMRIYYSTNAKFHWNFLSAALWPSGIVDVGLLHNYCKFSLPCGCNETPPTKP